MLCSLVVFASLAFSPAAIQDVNHILVQLTAQGEASPLKESEERPQRRNIKKKVKKTKTDVNKAFVQSVTGPIPTGYIQVGTPPKKVLVIFDTAGHKISLDQGIHSINQKSSSTYTPKLISKSKTGHTEGSDTVIIGPLRVKDFGITQNSPKLLHTKKGISGVLGLQHCKTLCQSIFSRMRDADQLTSFGYCRGTGDQGTFLWGDTSTEGQELAVIGKTHWAVSLGNIQVSPAAPTPRTPVIGGGGAAIFDTGSNVLALPSRVARDLARQVNVKHDCSNFDSLPTIVFSFGGKPVTVHPEGYVMKLAMPKMAGGRGGPKPTTPPPERQDRSLLQEDAMDGSWNAVFKHLREHGGIDLSTAMRDMFDFGNVALEPRFLCMPAFVPLDKKTRHGDLYVLGTPLLQTNYARWSWAKQDAAPKIFIEKLADSGTCKLAARTFADATASLEAIGSEPVPLMRSEQYLSSPNFVDGPVKRGGPMLRNIEDISYPHWAKDLEIL